MQPDIVLRCEGMKILTEHLGIVETERFIMLMSREPLDYTVWRKNLFGDIPLDKFLDDAMEYRTSMAVSSNTKEKNAN
jgi:hypothetical protein